MSTCRKKQKLDWMGGVGSVMTGDRGTHEGAAGARGRRGGGGWGGLLRHILRGDEGLQCLWGGEEGATVSATVRLCPCRV